MKKTYVVVSLSFLVLLLGLAGYLFFSNRPEKEFRSYVIEMQGPNGTAYFLDLAPNLKSTDDISKAKRFDKKDGDVWFTAIQQKMAINHEPPAVRKAVKLVGID